MASAAAAPAAMEGCDTPQKLWRLRCAQWAGHSALRHKKKGIWHSVSWSGYFEQARAVGLALSDRGLQTGQAVAILSENRPEWLYADMGAQAMGLIGVGLYPTASAEQVAFILQDSGARVLIVENQEQLDKALAVRGQCPELQHIVVIDLEGLRGLSDPQISTWEAFAQRGMALAQEPATRARFDAAIQGGGGECFATFHLGGIHNQTAVGRKTGAFIFRCVCDGGGIATVEVHHMQLESAPDARNIGHPAAIGAKCG
jgi:long-chain acyl-CoA synthetase